MKKLILSYFAYLVIVFGYFLFFYPLETFADTRYAAISHAVYFSKIPLPLLFLWMIIKRDLFRKWQEKIGWKHHLLSLPSLAFIFLIGYRFIQLPFDLLWFFVRRSAGTSHQPLISWFADQGLDFLFLWAGLSAFFLLFHLVVRRWSRGWPIILWLCLIPIVLIVVYVHPMWIDPLYHDFSPLPAGELRTDIEAVARSLHIEEISLLQVEMSNKVTTYNAYVNGIFGRTQVVFWDTMLNQMEHGEIMFVFAHELGHYVMNHFYIGVISYLFFGLILLTLTAVILNYLRKKFLLLSLTDIQMLPLFLFIILSLFVVTEPITLAVSREMERQADRFAIEHTEDLQAAQDSFVRMGTRSKADIDPATWIVWLRNSHPPLQERMDLLEQAINNR